MDEYEYDIFISYAPADREWVDEWLLPHLEGGAGRLRVGIDYRDFIVGMPRLENIERAMRSSRRTLVVLTPAWIESEWNSFEALLLRTMDPAARRRKLLPVLLQPCQLPEMIDALEKVDLTIERHWEKGLRRLMRDIEDTVPVELPWRQGQMRDVGQWRRWLRRYRRELRRGGSALLAVWLVAFMSLQWPPFQPRPVWTSLGLHASGATHLARAGDVLLVGGGNAELGCDQMQKGLWRSADQGTTWAPISPPLCFERPSQGQVLADIVGFAQSARQPERIYAATSDVGLLRSDDAGETWQRTGDSGLPASQLIAVSVDQSDTARVFVAARGGGLFRSDDAGGSWRRLDRQEGETACEQGQPLVGTLLVGALLTTSHAVVVGTGDPFDLNDSNVPSGLYASSDGGRCWRRVDDGLGRYEYRALAHAPTPQADYILILIHDWWKEPADKPTGIWRLDLGAAAPQRELLWAQQRAVGALAVAGQAWYIASPLGGVLKGTLDVPAHTQAMPRVTRCFAPPTCEVGLAPTPDLGPPLLLAGGRVFRLQRGPWWYAVWP